MGWSCGLPAFATTARPVGDLSSGDQIATTLRSRRHELQPPRGPSFSDNQDGCRIASSRNAPERVEHCLTRMLPAPRQFVNRITGSALRGVTQAGFPVRSASLLSRPDLALPKPRRAAEGIGRSGATRSHAQRAVAREHGEDGEHRTFPEVSTVAHSRRSRIGRPAIHCEA